MRLTIPAFSLFFLFLTTSALALPGGYSNESAGTMSPGRLEVGVFSPAKWAVHERVEVGMHPLGVFLLPSARVKVNWWNGAEPGRAFLIGSLHRISVPTPFLHFLAREGSGGLLPRDSEVPFAIQLESAALLSYVAGKHIATLQLGLGISLRENSDLPLLDFPFLYSTLAPLFSPVVGRAAISVEGNITRQFDYQLVQRMNLWRPDGDLAWPGGRAPTIYAQESVVRAHWRLGSRHRVSVGATIAVAHYPIGYRLHWLPTVDYRAVLF